MDRYISIDAMTDIHRSMLHLPAVSDASLTSLGELKNAMDVLWVMNADSRAYMAFSRQDCINVVAM